jgi:hypothetical protein
LWNTKNKISRYNGEEIRYKSFAAKDTVKERDLPGIASWTGYSK